MDHWYQCIDKIDNQRQKWFKRGLASIGCKFRRNICQIIRVVNSIDISRIGKNTQLLKVLVRSKVKSIPNQ